MQTLQGEIGRPTWLIGDVKRWAGFWQRSSDSRAEHVSMCGKSRTVIRCGSTSVISGALWQACTAAPMHEWYGTSDADRATQKGGGCKTWQEHLLFHNNPNPFTEGMVLFKHPFHLCWIPALRRDGRVERRACKSADSVGAVSTNPDKSDQNKTSTVSLRPEPPTVRVAERRRHRRTEGRW